MLTRHLPGYEVRPVARLDEGLDNTAYEVNGELIVRASKEAAPDHRSESTRREVDLLVAVNKLSSLPVPELIFADFEVVGFAYFKLPGVPLLNYAMADPALLARTLA